MASRRGPVKRRKQIAVGERVPLELTERERDLIMKHTFAGNDLTDRLRVVPGLGRRPFYRFTLDDLDELAGYVAAEANHAKVKKLEKELRQLYGRIADVWNPIRLSLTNPRPEGHPERLTYAAFPKAHDASPQSRRNS